MAVTLADAPDVVAECRRLANARYADRGDTIVTSVLRASAALLERQSALIEDARTGLSQILHCTPANTNFYDCGDPFEIARATLAKLEAHDTR